MIPPFRQRNVIHRFVVNFTHAVFRMKFLRSIYILIVVFAENRENFLVRCIADLEENELVHLSQKLNLLECLQLVKAVYEQTPARVEHERKKHGVLSERSNSLSTTSKECLLNLEQWNDDFSKNTKADGRSTMEITLRWLGRPDLAKYVRENRRSIKFLDREDYDIADTLEFPGHRVSRRHAPKNDKHSSAGGKKTKKKKKRGHCEHSQHTGIKNKGVQKAVAVAKGHAAARKTHQLSKKENQTHNKKDYIEQHRSICCSILFIIFFITLCLVAVYFLHRRSRLKARGTRFKYNNNANKDDKNTFTDSLEWNDQVVCSCSDVEDGCTGKCLMCSQDYQVCDIAHHRTDLDDSVNDPRSVCVQKVREKKEKKRPRFSFLQKNSQDKKKEKDQENRDRKCVKRKNSGTMERKGEQDALRMYIYI